MSVPQHMEQALNGHHVANLDADVAFRNSPPFGRVKAKELRTAVDARLADDDFRQNATYIGRSFREAGGYQQTVDVIETALR